MDEKQCREKLEELMKKIESVNVLVRKVFDDEMENAKTEYTLEKKINVPRKKIAIIDAAIAPLLKERFKLVDDIVEYKIRSGELTMDEEQRENVIERAIKYSNLDREGGEFKKEYIKRLKRIYYDIISEHETLQQIKRHSRDLFGIFWEECLLRAEEGTYKPIDENIIKIPKDKFPFFWHQANLYTNISYNSTNFVNSEDLYSDWAKDMFKYQGMVRKAWSTSVRRLFIVMDKTEANEDFVDHLSWQASLGFEVGIISKEKKMGRPLFDELKKLVETIDISIFNGRYLAASLLTGDDKRSISFLKVYSDPKIVSKVDDILNKLWDYATPAKDIDKFLKEGE